MPSEPASPSQPRAGSTRSTSSPPRRMPSATLLPSPADACCSLADVGCTPSGSCGPALRECARVLAPEGRFAAVEPWRGPLYGIGTALLGKRDRRVRCVVLDA